MVTLDPWERQPYDSDESWATFHAYRDQLAPRRMLGIHLRPGNGRPVSPILVSRWATAHFWRERVAAYDKHLDDIRVAETETQLAQSSREVAAQHMALLASARETLAREIEKMRATSTESGGEIMRPRDLIHFAEVVIKLDRLVRGESTDRVDTGPDLSNLSDADLAELDASLKKAGINAAIPNMH